MPIFEDRQKAAERRFEQANEAAFKLIARRNKLLGLWAAAQMGLTGEAALRYAMNIVESQVTERDDMAITKKLCGDLNAGGFPMSEQDVSQQVAMLTAKAREELSQSTEPDV